MAERRLRFEVGFPWGSSFCDGLRAALDQLGYATAENPLVEGSDLAGFLLAPSKDELRAGETLIEEAMPALEAVIDQSSGDSDPWWELFHELRDALRARAVYAIEYDSKHFEWDGNYLDDVGLELELVSEHAVSGELRYVFEVWRTRQEP